MTFPQQMIDNMTPAERVRYGYPLPESVALELIDAARRLELLEDALGYDVPGTPDEIDELLATLIAEA